MKEKNSRIFKCRQLELTDGPAVILLLKQLTQKSIKLDVCKILKDKHCHCLVIEDKKTVIGFAALILHIVPSRGYVGRIEDVVVAENYRGLGLGKKLMEELLGIAKKKKIKTLNLTSNSRRVVARKLYKSLGFELKDTGTFKLEL